MSNRLRFWDGLVFGFTASLTLWQDLPAVAVILVLATVLGAAMVMVASKRGVQ
jgi:hypothetical protein